jgi:hypothetical protein
VRGRTAVRIASRCLAALAGILALSGVPGAVAHAVGTNPHGSTARICNVATQCPTIVAVAKPTSSAHDISKFLSELWSVNFEGGPSGAYQLQRCANPGPSPYRVECVLFSTGSAQDLDALRAQFLSSRLFVSIKSSI